MFDDFDDYDDFDDAGPDEYDATEDADLGDQDDDYEPSFEVPPFALPPIPDFNLNVEQPSWNVPNEFPEFRAPSEADLQSAADLKELSERHSSDSPWSVYYRAESDAISGANFPGLDGIRREVMETSHFFGTERPNVYYEPGELGMQFGGFTDQAYDNWIGGDPEVLNEYAQEYGDDFVSCVFGHEAGHNVVERLGLSSETSRLANEVAADRLAGLYAGSKGLDKSGIVAFFRAQPSEGVFDDDGTQLYLGGEERAREFEEGYAEGAALTKAYPWRSFESFVRDPRFDLRGYVRKIVERFR